MSVADACVLWRGVKRLKFTDVSARLRPILWVLENFNHLTSRNDPEASYSHPNCREKLKSRVRITRFGTDGSQRSWGRFVGCDERKIPGQGPLAFVTFSIQIRDRIRSLSGKVVSRTNSNYRGLCSCVPEWPTALTRIVRISFRLFRRILGRTFKQDNYSLCVVCWSSELVTRPRVNLSWDNVNVTWGFTQSKRQRRTLMLL